MMMFVKLSDVVQEVELKVDILGDGGVGKTALVNRYIHQRFDEEYRATIGADCAGKFMSIDEKLVNLQIWDSAGQEMYHSLCGPYFKSSHCCILVYDVNSAKSFGALDKWIGDFIRQSPLEHPETIQYILVGNKIDVDGGRKREVSEAQARHWCQSRGNVPYYETSAKDGTNVDAAFLDIITIALAVLDQKTRTEPGTVVELGETSESETDDSRCAC